jgi:hypothetical protein
MGQVTFIRKNGRVIPIRGASGGSTTSLRSKARQLGSKLASEYLEPGVSYVKRHPVKTAAIVGGTLTAGAAALGYRNRKPIEQKVTQFEKRFQTGQRFATQGHDSPVRPTPLGIRLGYAYQKRKQPPRKSKAVSGKVIPGPTVNRSTRKSLANVKIPESLRRSVRRGVQRSANFGRKLRARMPKFYQF